jgi:hypothetical protein
MNKYKVDFFSLCPENKIRIHYLLVIEIESVVSVEELLSCVSSYHLCYHEEIADDLHSRFGGKQTIVAEHHGVTIETTRS